ncbi:MAG TPA: AMP-binding protein [Thermoleophilaceae bacterium]|nr:AMP-binding protein [Thermoleophilaceae bacterium]
MRVEAGTTIEAPAEAIWEVVTDPSVATSYYSGITRWDVAGEQERGLGARYTMRMQVRAAEVGSLIEVVEWLENEDMAWTSITGLDQRGRWRLREREPGKTEVTLRLAYQAPGGLLGTLSDRVSAPIVRGHLTKTLENLKRLMEGDTMSDSPGPGLRGLIENKLHAVRVLAGAGVVKPVRPDRMVRALMAVSHWERTPAGGYAANAARYPDTIAIVDELGTLTFSDVHRRTNAIANALADAGVKQGDNVGIMCRNHRWFVEATVACSKLGAHCLFLNTAFAGPQLTDVTKREKPTALIYDEEFSDLLADASKRRKRFIAWAEEDMAADRNDPTLEEIVAAGDFSEPKAPDKPGRTIILTSGTTGTPKGANRAPVASLEPAVSILGTIPLRARETWFIVAPMFHSWGFAHFTLGLLLSSTLVLRRRFDPEDTLRTIAEHRPTSAPMVPVMAQRIMELPDDTRRKYDVSSLTAIPLSGSALPGELALKVMDEFGDVVYNLYGSTEVAWASIATPQDLRSAPGTAGKPPHGTVLRILDEAGNPLPQGETGRIFVANEMLFEGYTGGGNKEVVGGLMSTGDVGHLDEAGRLFVSGRDDEMIVSGGENVFPREVEDLLSRHEAVNEVAVIGVEDKEFGQRLKAFVVLREGASLSDDEVRAYVKKNLARYKVPRDVEFLDELPRNATGKVLKRELAKGEKAGK